MKKIKRTLVIVYNRFYLERGTSYVELVYDPAANDVREVKLKQRPRQARFDKVLETGDGSYSQWNAHKARRVYGHKLEWQTVVS